MMRGLQAETIVPGDLVRVVGFPVGPALFAVECFDDLIRVLCPDGVLKFYWRGDLEVVNMTPRRCPKDV